MHNAGVATYNAFLAFSAVMRPWRFVFVTSLAVSRPVCELFHLESLLGGRIRTLSVE
jgi:hypothetical protein